MPQTGITAATTAVSPGHPAIGRPARLTAYRVKRRCTASWSTSSRLRAPWSAAMNWSPIATEKAIRLRASRSSVVGADGPNSARR